MSAAPPRADIHCPACERRAEAPLACGLPVDVRWEWSEVPWTPANFNFEVRRGQVRHIFHIGAEHPVCAPWWDTGFIAPLD